VNGDDPISTLNWLAVLTAAFSTFMLGGLWYGPLFGRVWMRASGMTEEKAKLGSPVKIFGISFALQLVAAALGVIFLFEQRSLTQQAPNESMIR
jgi:hypothetical protein